MSLYPRKNSPYWYYKICHKGEVLQGSTGTHIKAKAQEFHDKLKNSLWEQERLGVKPVYVWEDAVLKYLEETKHKASQVSDIYHLRWLDNFLNGVELQVIKRDLLDKISAAKQSEGVKNSTVNRMLEVVRAILNKALNEWEWLDRVPMVRMLSEPTKRVRWIAREEADRLISELPPHLADMTCFSLETGLRKNNVTGLQWTQIDLERCCAWIHPDQAKAGKAIHVPLSDVAIAVLVKQIGKHQTNVFTFNGKPVHQVNTKAWHKALGRAGIVEFRWHDLRHTWASWHVQRGTPLNVLMELGGWSTLAMVMKYAHLSSDHLKQWVNPKPVDLPVAMLESS